MREIFPGVIGNDAVKENIGRRIADGKNSHAYIIEGPHGSGKRMMALMIAAAASCVRRYDETFPLPCGECDTCRRILGGISVDTVMIPSADKASIGVDEIRALRAGLYTLPNDSDVRTYIIRNAERMTEAAQNALLLTLEEPPTHALFLLLTENSSGLLETVRSRSILVRTEHFTDDDIKKYLKNHIPAAKDEEINTAAKIGDGSIGRALEVLSPFKDSSDDISIRSVAEEFVSVMCHGDRTGLLKYLLPSFRKSSEEAVFMLSEIDCAVRDIISVLCGGSSDLLFFTSASQARSIGGNVSRRRLFSIHDAVCEAILRLRANVSVKVTMTDFALSI